MCVSVHVRACLYIYMYTHMQMCVCVCLCVKLHFATNQRILHLRKHSDAVHYDFFIIVVIIIYIFNMIILHMIGH